MNLLKFINIHVFIISFAIGIFAVYITTQDATRKIYVYPTHENANILQYKDKTDTCFSIVEEETPCPENPKKISKIPVQA
jgi:hypothetical protein